ARAKAYAGASSPASGQAKLATPAAVDAAAAAAASKPTGPWALRQLLGLVLVLGGVGLIIAGGSRVLGVRTGHAAAQVGKAATLAAVVK
ncbi:MAG: hypothetical protein JWR63_4298, partial [Conexibacter sp.]|nr:hypothetical protein [Conexibacter sp.]